jgi:DNA polymerase III subunit delta'
MHHHALLVRRAITAEAAVLLCDYDEEVEVFVVPETEIGIGEVRALTIEASRLPREKSSRLLVVVVASLTSEAQQALLKLLEEPPVTTSFLFVIPPEISLLPTLASRFFTLAVETEPPVSVVAAFSDWQNCSLGDRLEEVGKRITKKDSVWVEAIHNGLKAYIQQAHAPKEDLHVLSFVLAHLNTRGASNKLLLEELALSLPPSSTSQQDGTL